MNIYATMETYSMKQASTKPGFKARVFDFESCGQGDEI